MKKITYQKKWNIYLLFLLFLGFQTYAQCIRNTEFGNIVSNNSGTFQTITTCAYSNAEYSVISGLVVGQNYEFTAQTGSTAGAGTHVYITITNASNTVIQHGPSPLTVNNISATTVRLHYSADAACGGSSSCHNSRIRLITSCVVPAGLTSSNLTTTGATIAWTAPSTLPSGGFDYYYSTSNTAPTATTTPTGNVPNTVTSVGLTGLNPSTQYYFWVRSNCGTENSVWSSSGTFTTLCVAFTPPYLQDFTTFLPSCWDRGDNGDLAAGPATFGANNWAVDGFANNGFSGSARYNLYLASANDWLITPYFTIPASGYEIRFNAAATQYASTNAPSTPWEADDYVEVLVSTGSTNWTVLYTFNDSNVPSNLGDIITIDLDAYASQTVRFAIRAVEGTSDGAADIDFFVDNFEVRQTPSCVEPLTLTASSITVNSAVLGWNEMGTATAWNIQYGAPGFTLGSGTTVAVTTNPYTLSGLTSNTPYCFYVQADCGSGSLSPWAGPFCFNTACDPFGSFTENFDTTPNNTITSCWAKKVVSTDGFAAVNTVNFGANSAPNAVQLYNSGDTNAELYLITPSLTALANGTHRLKFRASGGTNYTLFVGTMSDPTNQATFNEIEPLQVPGGYNEYIVNFSNVTTDTYIAFKHGLGGTYRTIYIDNVVWEPIPTTVPGCATVTATPHPTCGNFDTTFAWPAVLGADGYKISIGTTAGANDILNQEELGNVLTYAFDGNFNTTYFYTVIPYNNVGNATGCTEQSFTTFATGCYCTTLPTSNDGSGITNVVLGATSFTTPDVMYFDHTSTPVTLAQGLNTNLQISFATGYTYNTYVWIDFNDNLTFESSELVYTGESAVTNPTTLNASFIMPANAALGTHRMRIVTADTLTTPNPCYSGSWGVSLDFSVIIVASSCTPPAATAIVTPDCANNQYFIDVNVTALGNGNPSITDGTNTWPTPTTGVFAAGPFANGSTVSLIVLHGSDSTCNLPLGTFVYNCPPVNDDCIGAIALTPGGDFAANAITVTNAAATNSNPPAPGCASFQGGDVWFSVVVPASGNITVETNTNPGSSLTDSGMAVYSGSCGALTLVECDDDDSANGNMSMIVLTGQTPGTTLMVNVWRYGGGTGDTFKVSAYDASLSNNGFDVTNFVAYPNPVKDILNLSYSSEINQIKVMNLRGQVVLTKQINSTSAQIDMSSLDVAPYIVTITMGDITKTIKVIKQ